VLRVARIGVGRLSRNRHFELSRDFVRIISISAPPITHSTRLPQSLFQARSDNHVISFIVVSIVSLLVCLLISSFDSRCLVRVSSATSVLSQASRQYGLAGFAGSGACKSPRNMDTKTCLLMLCLPEPIRNWPRRSYHPPNTLDLTSQDVKKNPTCAPTI
jgi:hypothetical protein